MPPKSSWWDHFWSKEGVYYKGDKTHVAAWCLRCLEYEKETLLSADAAAVETGSVSSCRTMEQIHNAGKFPNSISYCMRAYNLYFLWKLLTQVLNVFLTTTTKALSLFAEK